MKKILLVLFSSFLLLANVMASVIPYKMQSAFLFKIFGSDKQLAKVSEQQIIIAIVFDSKNANSQVVKDGMFKEFSSAVKINRLVGLPVSNNILLIDVNEEDWKGKMKDISIVYVADGLSDYVKDISKLCIENQIRSFSVDKTYLINGISTAVVFEAGKPKIYINKEVAKTTGIQFNAMVLQYATEI